jgi:hypothetical protein
MSTETILSEYFYKVYAEALQIKIPESCEEKANFWVKYHEGTDLYIPEDMDPDYLVSCHETAWLVDNKLTKQSINLEVIDSALASWLQKKQ